MAFQTQGGDDEVMSEINVTPLVDVMLVLLVVFIVTAPLLTNTVNVNLPKTAATAPPEQKEAVSVSVDAQGKVYVDKQMLPLELLEEELIALRSRDPELVLHLQADDAVDFGQVARVMAIVERSGISKLAVVTKQE